MKMYMDMALQRRLSYGRPLIDDLAYPVSHRDSEVGQASIGLAMTLVVLC